MLPWRDVVEAFFRTALDVEGHWANTKFVSLGFVPGKAPMRAKLTDARGYAEACEVLGLEALRGRAAEVDRRLGITAWLAQGKEAGEGGRRKGRKRMRSPGGDAVEREAVRGCLAVEKAVVMTE